MLMRMMRMMVVMMTLLMTTRTILFSTREDSACSVGRRVALPRGRVREKRERFRVAFPLPLYWIVRPGSCVR